MLVKCVCLSTHWQQIHSYKWEMTSWGIMNSMNLATILVCQVMGTRLSWVRPRQAQVKLRPSSIMQVQINGFNLEVLSKDLMRQIDLVSRFKCQPGVIILLQGLHLAVVMVSTLEAHQCSLCLETNGCWWDQRSLAKVQKIQVVSV